MSKIYEFHYGKNTIIDDFFKMLRDKYPSIISRKRLFCHEYEVTQSLLDDCSKFDVQILKEKSMRKLAVYIEGDTNDGDYISSLTELEDGQIDLIRKFAKCVKIVSQTDRHNWPTSEYDDCTVQELYIDTGLLTEEESEQINHNGYVPFGEFGIHTIKEIKIVEIKEELL